MKVTSGISLGLAFCRAIQVGLLILAWLIIAYNASHSSALRDRNIALVLVLTFDLAVGGDRIEMSNAVPRRSGTRGVSSKATSGRIPWSSLSEQSDTIPSDTLPVDTLPSDTLPVDTLPVDTLPSDTLPSSSVVRAALCAADIWYASIRPGETTIEHWLGCKSSHTPLSDQE